MYNSLTLDIVFINHNLFFKPSSRKWNRLNTVLRHKLIIFSNKPSGMTRFARLLFVSSLGSPLSACPCAPAIRKALGPRVTVCGHRCIRICYIQFDFLYYILGSDYVNQITFLSSRQIKQSHLQSRKPHRIKTQIGLGEIIWECMASYSYDILLGSCSSTVLLSFLGKYSTGTT